MVCYMTIHNSLHLSSIILYDNDDYDAVSLLKKECMARGVREKWELASILLFKKNKRVLLHLIF